jgi:hypothetical protein
VAGTDEGGSKKASAMTAAAAITANTMNAKALEAGEDDGWSGTQRNDREQYIVPQDPIQKSQC